VRGRRSLTGTILAVLGAACLHLQIANAAAPSFCAAYFHPDGDGHLLTLFPTDGGEVMVPLPPGLPRGAGAIFGPAGKNIYVVNGSSFHPEALREIQFGPLRESVVPGTAGFGAIWHFTVAQPSGHIFISGALHPLALPPLRTDPECGTVEIEPDTGAQRKVLAGHPPGCGGGAGAVSPDGKRAITYSGGELGVVNLEGMAIQPIKGLGDRIGPNEVRWGSLDGTHVTWSPDGKWITIILDRKLMLIDASDTSRRRRLGSLNNGTCVWSPDSKYLLLGKSHLRCALAYGFFESLEVLEVATGKRTIIKSSRCKVGVGAVGWVDPEVVR
jgi:hypothetical protein